jgi:hypothetical protein
MIQDDSVLSQIEQRELDRPIARKVLGDQAITTRNRYLLVQACRFFAI